MQAHPNDLEIQNNEAGQQFEANVDGDLAFVEYRRSGNKLVLVHTEVPEALEGRGIGSQLAHAALEYARAQHLGVVPLCPFVASYIRRHPEYQDLVHPSSHT